MTRWISWSFILAVLAGAGVSSFAEETPSEPVAWRWEFQENAYLALHGPSCEVFKLHFSPETVAPYFDPLNTPSGEALIWNGPGDHVWHRGLWFSWKYINGVNFWEYEKPTGRPAGTIRIKSVELVDANDKRAILSYRLLFSTKPDGAPVLIDEVTLRCETPKSDGSYAIDWHRKSTALSDVQLNRTPLPHEPDGKPFGGYAGLSCRFSKDLGDVVVQESKGNIGMDGHGNAARWMDMTGEQDGKTMGVALFDHPSNRDYPTKWFVVQREKATGDFNYTNAALLYDGPIELKKGETLDYRWRVLVHQTRTNPETMEQEFTNFTKH